MKMVLYIACCSICFKSGLASAQIVERDYEGDGVSISKEITRNVVIGRVSDIQRSADVVAERLKTGSVVSFAMSEGSNITMQFFGKLPVSDSVKDVTITNVHENNLNFQEILNLFPETNELEVFYGDEIECSFINLKELRRLSIDGVISGKSIRSLSNLQNLEYVSCWAGSDITLSDLIGFKKLKKIKKIILHDYPQDRIPKALIEKVKKDEDLSSVIEFLSSSKQPEK